MSNIPLSKARAQLQEIINKVGYGFLEALEDIIDYEDAMKSLKDIKKNGSVAWNKVKSDLGI